MPIVPRVLARFLRRADAIVPHFLVRGHGFGDVLFAGEFEADGERAAVFHGLTGALGGRGQEWVRCIADQGDAGFGRYPGGKWIAVDDFPVHTGWGCADGADDRIPAFETSEGVFNFARRLPAFFDVCIILRILLAMALKKPCGIRTLCVQTQLKSLPSLNEVARKCLSGPTQALKVSPFSTMYDVSGLFLISVESSQAR